MVDEFLRVDAWYGMVWLGEPQLVPSPRGEFDGLDFIPDGVIMNPASPHGAYLLTATHSGAVGIQVRIAPAPEPLVESEWDVIQTIEVSLRSTSFAVESMGGGHSIDPPSAIGQS